MTDPDLPLGRADSRPPEAAVEQTATVEGTDNITVQAGGDAHVTVHPSRDQAELVRHLAPFLVAVVVLSAFGDQLDLIGRIVVAVATVGWMIWVAARDTYLRLVQRFALPVIAAVYTISLTVFTAIPDLPLALQIAAPATCWIAAAIIVLRLTETDHRTHTTLQYTGTAAIGLGVALIGVGVAMALDGATLLGVALIGLGVAGIGVGVAMALDGATLLGVAGIGLGVALIGEGVALFLAGDLLLGVVVIGGGVAAIGLGVAMLLDGATLSGVAMIGGGVALIGGGVAVALDGDTLFGVALIGLGVALIGLGVALFLDGDTLFGVALIGGGVALIGFGVAMALDGATLLGVAGIGVGVALIGGGVAVFRDEDTLSGATESDSVNERLGAGSAALGRGWDRERKPRWRCGSRSREK